MPLACGQLPPVPMQPGPAPPGARPIPMPTRSEAIAQLTAPGEMLELIETEAIGRRVRAFRNAPANLRELYQAACSDLPFLVYGEERLSFAQTWAQACRLAQAMVHEFGVAAGDRVALSLRNYPEWVVGFMAATSIGAIAVGMNALWQAEEMQYALGDAAPKVLILDAERLERLAQATARPAGMAVIAVRVPGPLPAGVHDFAGLIANHPAQMPAGAVLPDMDAIMLYTSGSTGHPKGAVSTHRNVITALLNWELETQAAVLCGVLPAPVAGAPQAATLLAIPLFHVTGSHAVFLASFRSQRRIVSMYKWDPAEGAALIARERITSFVAPAAVTGDLVAYARAHNCDLSSLAVVGGGGAPRAPEQVRAIATAFGAARPNTGWGMTETNAIGTGIAAGDYLDHPESSGRCAAVLDLRVVDGAGHVLGVGERGELQVRGTTVFRGYWNRPEANAASFVDGDWFRTGDVACFDADGFVYIVDRIKDLVIRGGENIGCGAVEAALLEHPAVHEACVYGVPDPRLGEELAASIYADSIYQDAPLDAQALRDFLAPRLARFEIPRYIDIRHAPLPRIAAGKIFKRELRAQAIAGLAQDAPLHN